MCRDSFPSSIGTTGSAIATLDFTNFLLCIFADTSETNSRRAGRGSNRPPHQTEPVPSAQMRLNCSCRDELLSRKYADVYNRKVRTMRTLRNSNVSFSSASWTVAMARTVTIMERYIASVSDMCRRPLTS